MSLILMDHPLIIMGSKSGQKQNLPYGSCQPHYRDHPLPT
jgi:hypothetical protein